MGHLGPVCQLKPYFGLMWAKTVIWPHLGPRGSNLNHEDTFPRYKPHFLWFPPLILSLSPGRIQHMQYICWPTRY